MRKLGSCRLRPGADHQSIVSLWRELGEERALQKCRAVAVVLEASRRRLHESARPKLPSRPPPQHCRRPRPRLRPSRCGNPPSSTVTGTQEDWDAYRRRMMRDPRYREVQREQGRLTLAQRRANLIRLVGLTPAQADAVIDLQIEREWQRDEQMVNPATENSD